MTETATETTDAPETGATTENDDQGRDNDGAAMAKALKKANKEAETLRLRVKEFEDATKTEQDKLTERTAKAEKAAADAHRDYLRLKVGTAKGLDPELAERLRGDDEAEMAADADRLAQAFRPKTAGSFDAGAKDTAPPGGDNFLTAAIRAKRGG